MLRQGICQLQDHEVTQIDVETEGQKLLCNDKDDTEKLGIQLRSVWIMAGECQPDCLGHQF